MTEIKFNREFSMPNSKTFKMAPIKKIIERNMPSDGIIVDPFANTNTYANITNDIDPSMPTQYHMDATEFLKQLDSECADMVLWDPPYSPRQVSECYKKFGMTVNMQTTQSSYWSKQKEHIARIVKPGGKVITFGWNSGGVGKKYGFSVVEILLVHHGGWHNDTICTVEIKN